MREVSVFHADNDMMFGKVISTCHNQIGSYPQISSAASRSVTTITLVLAAMFLLFLPQPVWANNTEQAFITAGLIDIRTIEPSIKVDLVNSDPAKNYFREDFYKGLTKAYLRREVAFKLKEAQKKLQLQYPSYSLLVLDAARPRSVSAAMYEKMKGTRFEKYVANPAKGSMHNYGIAVDITIVDQHGKELDMGFTPFNKSTFQLYSQFALLKLGKGLSKEQRANRRLLANIMQRAGFYPLSYEWWHFNGMEKAEARKRFAIIE